MKAKHKAVNLITDVGLTNSPYVVKEVKMVIQGLIRTTCSSSAVEEMRYWDDVEKHVEKLKNKIWTE